MQHWIGLQQPANCKTPPIITIEEGVTICEFMFWWLQINKAYVTKGYIISWNHYPSVIGNKIDFLFDVFLF